MIPGYAIHVNGSNWFSSSDNDSDKIGRLQILMLDMSVGMAWHVNPEDAVWSLNLVNGFFV